MLHGSAYKLVGYIMLMSSFDDWVVLLLLVVNCGSGGICGIVYRKL